MEKLAEGFKGQKAIIMPKNICQYQSSNLITRQLYVTHIGYYPNAKYHYFERSQGANQNIFIYCSEGKGWIYHKGIRIILSRNQAYVIGKNEMHAYGAENRDPWSIYWIHFLGENTGMFSSLFGRIIQIEESDKSRYMDRFLLFEEMFQNLEMGYNPDNLEYTSFCLMHFFASIKYINQYREINNVKEIDVIQKSIIFMKNNLENKITLQKIASHVGYSVSHFGLIFSERTSFSPIEYYNQLKIQRACSYLQFSDLKLKEIAFRLGFFDPFHFSKAFKKEMGTTPREYRNKYMEDRGLVSNVNKRKYQ